MAIEQIKILELSDMKIIKKINVVATNRNQRDLCIGFLMYERELNEKYRFKNVNTELNTGRFNHLASYPTPESFPSDNLDEQIILAVRSQFQNSEVENIFLFSNRDVEYIENLKERPFEKADIYIQPDFSNQDIEELRGKILNDFNKKVNIYVQGSSEEIKNLIFKGECDLESSNEVFNNLNSIKFI